MMKFHLHAAKIKKKNLKKKTLKYIYLFEIIPMSGADKALIVILNQEFSTDGNQGIRE